MGIGKESAYKTGNFPWGAEVYGWTDMYISCWQEKEMRIDEHGRKVREGDRPCHQLSAWTRDWRPTVWRARTRESLTRARDRSLDE